MDPLTHHAVTPNLAGHVTGRACQLMHAEREVRALRTGMDFRDVRYRREVFTRFYLFHLMHRAHPGCVYYVMPHLARAHQEPWDLERQLWFAFINGCTQNPVTSLIIMRRFPFAELDETGLDNLERWFNEKWSVLPFDTDRRYQKKEFPRAVRTYHAWLGGRSQADAFREALPWKWTWQASDIGYFRVNGGRFAMDMGNVCQGYAEANFDALWKLVGSKAFWGFGRLGTWSYLEYLFIAGLPLEPSSMMLRDMGGSKSHRNGLAKVLGRDDLDWVKGGPFDGRYSPEVLSWLEAEADALLEEVRERAAEWNERSNHPQINPQHVSRFTFESALCTFKGWFRENRRYPNVYDDMLRDRIVQAQELWPEEDLSVFWDARREALPPELRVEDCPTDPGLARPKQNHFRLTGQVPMMGHTWGVFRDHCESWRLPA